MLLAREEMAHGHSESACRANGQFDRFQNGNVSLALLLALEVIEELECLNASLQSRSQTVDGMLAAVNCVKDTISKKRTEDAFQSVYDKATQMCNSLNLSPVEMPCVQNPPKRLSGQGSAHVPTSSAVYFGT